MRLILETSHVAVFIQKRGRCLNSRIFRASQSNEHRYREIHKRFGAHSLRGDEDGKLRTQFPISSTTIVVMSSTQEKDAIRNYLDTQVVHWFFDLYDTHGVRFNEIYQSIGPLPGAVD
jgi:hypothetical protein